MVIIFESTPAWQEKQPHGNILTPNPPPALLPQFSVSIQVTHRCTHTLTYAPRRKLLQNHLENLEFPNCPVEAMGCMD